MIRFPSRVIQRGVPRAALPINAGGLGGRFFSLLRRGVTGKGNGAKDSPPVRPCGLAFGGGPQSMGPVFSSWPNTIPEALAAEAVQRMPVRCRKWRRETEIGRCRLIRCLTPKASISRTGGQAPHADNSSYFIVQRKPPLRQVNRGGTTAFVHNLPAYDGADSVCTRAVADQFLSNSAFKFALNRLCD